MSPEDRVKLEASLDVLEQCGSLPKLTRTIRELLHENDRLLRTAAEVKRLAGPDVCGTGSQADPFDVSELRALVDYVRRLP